VKKNQKTKICPYCGQIIKYDIKYQSFYCQICDAQIEEIPRMDERKCEYCSNTCVWCYYYSKSTSEGANGRCHKLNQHIPVDENHYCEDCFPKCGESCPKLDEDDLPQIKSNPKKKAYENDEYYYGDDPYEEYYSR
jgi:hypothetical protein